MFICSSLSILGFLENVIKLYTNDATGSLVSVLCFPSNNVERTSSVAGHLQDNSSMTSDHDSDCKSEKLFFWKTEGFLNKTSTDVGSGGRQTAASSSFTLCRKDLTAVEFSLRSDGACASQMNTI